MKPYDLLQLGMGAAFIAKDRVEDFLTDLEKRGELSRDEAKKFMDEAKTRAEEERSALDARIKEKVKEAMEELGLATKDDIEALKKLMKKK